MTFIAALRCDEIKALCVFDQPINAKNSWLGFSNLIPTLRPGAIVILDNLQSHQAKAVPEAIRAVGAILLFLPAYSSDLNPIEQVFAKLKHLMRKAAERTAEDTRRSIGELMNHFSPAEYHRYLVYSGCASGCFSSHFPTRNFYWS